MKKTLLTFLLTAAPVFLTSAAPSILDIKHSIDDNHIVPPESFETKTRELEENFYMRNYVVRDSRTSGEKLGTARDYEKRLASLPTDIEMPYNDIVGKYINMYLGKRRGLVADMLALHSYYGNIFVEELEKEKMPLELQYLPVIESAINPNAVSRAGAAGLWQFMPGTARGLGMEINSMVDERRDPRMSSRNAAKYLHQLYDIYGDWSLAIAAYNCGPGNVNKALRRAGGGKKDFWEIYNYLPSETRGYVPAFIAANYVMNFYDKHNIAPTVVRRHLTTDTVKVNKRVHFNQIAEVLNIPVDEIRMLNPQYRKDVIPGDYHPYVLTLPKQQVLSYLISEDAIINHDADLYARRTYVEPGGAKNELFEAIDENGQRNLSAAERQSENANANVEVDLLADTGVRRITHTVGRGENIKDIAKHYSVSATDIKRWNKLRRGKVKEGDQLIIETRECVNPDDVKTVAAKTTQTRRQNDAGAVPPPPQRKEKEQPGAVPPPAKRTKADKASAGSEAGRRYAEESSRQSREKSTREDKSSTRNRQQADQSSSKKKQSKKEQASTNTKKGRSAKTTVHNVKSGESLEKIARKHGVTVDELRKANPKLKGDRIQPDQKLNVPSKKKNLGSSVKKSGSKTSKGKSTGTGKSSSKKSSKKKRK